MNNSLVPYSGHVRQFQRPRALRIAVLTAVMSASASALADISFQDVSSQAGLHHAGETYGASWGDFNGDGYPDLVVSNHRNRDSLYVNKGNGSFKDLGGQVKTWVYHTRADTHGASWMDYDNDGDQDLLVSSGTWNANQFLVNEFGELVDRTAAANLPSDLVGARLPVWVDYNRDSRPDIIMANRQGSAPVYLQLADGTFETRTRAVGMTCTIFHYGQLFDLNSDNRLDFLCGTADASTNGSPFPQAAFDLRYIPFRTLTGILPPMSKAMDTAIADFDGDLHEDIFAVRGILRPSGVAQQGRTIEALLIGGNKGFRYVSRGKQAVELHWNKGEESAGVPNIKIGANGFSPSSSTFTLDPADPKVAGLPTYDTADMPLVVVGYNPSTGEWTFINASGTSFSNAYFIVTADADISALKGTGLWPGDKPMLPQLALHKPTGFIDATAGANLNQALSCISTVAGDFDNDMDVDIYAACRSGPANIPNVLFENQGNGTFAAVPNAGGAAGPVGLAVSNGNGAADTAILADFDVDGFLDLFITNGFNMRPLNTGGPDKLFKNRGNSHHWVQVDLVATESMRDAIGARVFATARGKTQVRTQNGAYHRWAQDSKRLHFGLATATRVDFRVEWPSGSTEVFSDLAVDRVYRITEGGAIAAVRLGEGQPLPCGAPAYNVKTDHALVVWKECVSQVWRVRAVAGDASTTYTGTLTSSADITSQKGFSLESADVLDSDTRANAIAFRFNVGKGTQDGMDIKLAVGASACLDVNASQGGVKVVFGPLAAKLELPLDLSTGKTCTP